MENLIIYALETDSDFQELFRIYEAPNVFIIEKIQDENDHTRFIKWLLDPSSNHKAGTIPMKLFIDLINNKTNDESERIHIDEAELKNMELNSEYPIPSGRLDVFGKSDSLILVIENKINAKENQINGLYQTDRYYDYFQNKYSDLQKCYIYLKPKANPFDPNNKNFMVISYQELYDYVILPCINNESIMPETKTILENYAVAISHPDNQIIRANTELRNRIFQKHKEAFIMIKKVMEDLNRDKSSRECEFYDNYQKYIDLILRDQALKIVPATQSDNNDYSLDKLVNDGLVHVDEDLTKSTELHFVRNKIHYVIQIFDQNGTYMCYIGYTKVEDYDDKNDIDALTDDEGNVMFFSSIHKAAVEAELDAEKKIVEKEKNRPAPTNPGKSPKEWTLRFAGKPEYEGKTIGEAYDIFKSMTLHQKQMRD